MLELHRHARFDSGMLRCKMTFSPPRPLPRNVAGADAAFSSDKRTVFAAAVVYDRELRQAIDIAHATMPAEFPYVPGFLSFREGPAVMAAIKPLKHPFRVPEPTCQADIEVGKLKKSFKS